jgi:hypothetical protein
MPPYKIILNERKSEASTARESRESVDAVKNKLRWDDLDKMCARAVKEEGERFVSPVFFLNVS